MSTASKTRAAETACEACGKTTVEIHRCVSILPNDYVGLENLPSINRVTLIGEKSARELSLLSSCEEDYETITLDDAKAENAAMVILVGNTPKRMTLNYLPSGEDVPGGFKTTKEVDFGATIGSYQFVEKNK